MDTSSPRTYPVNMSGNHWVLIDGSKRYAVPAFEVPAIQRCIDAVNAGAAKQTVDFVPEGSAERVRLEVTDSTHLLSPSGEVV